MTIHRDLTIVLETHKAKAYNWGKWDCMTFVNDCLEVMTGVDHMNNLETYDSQAGAVRALQKLNYKSAFGYFMDKYEGIPVSSVRVGDLVFLKKGANKLTAPAVVFGDVAISRTYNGWIYKRPSDFTVGFKVA